MIDHESTKARRDEKIKIFVIPLFRVFVVNFIPDRLYAVAEPEASAFK